tara:strand:- start:4571 stop:6259 length:1689 start_codon:yes stop_codon:yes gene_type:complete
MQYFKVKKNKQGKKVIETQLAGKPILTIPQLNKGTAFSQEERRSLGLLGKLPGRVEDLDGQVQRAYQQFCDYTLPIHKNIFLNVLHNTNEVLFYALIKKHFKEMMPIVYTPVVGDSVVDFSKSFRQTRGLYVSYEDIDNLEEIFQNRTNQDVQLIVITDGSGVLGIGDQGVGGMGIPIAKLVLYTAIGGISPYNTLPVVLDVGTDNQTLLDDPLYLGWRHPRINEKEYQHFIEKVISCIKQEYDRAFIHWEDFSAKNAVSILDRYREKMCTFNDDIQGTGVVALAAILAALKRKGSNIKGQRILIFGAGAAGCGIAEHLFHSMIKLGFTEQEAKDQFWLIDRQGLLFDDSDNISQVQMNFARSKDERPLFNEYSLHGVVKVIKPTILIGCSAVAGSFTDEILRDLASLVDHPVILPLSNPTERAEATPEAIYTATLGRVFVATGSPFPAFSFGGKAQVIGQCNNAYAFPGIGLAVVAVKARRITDEMLYAASEAICDYVVNNKYSDQLITPIPEMSVEIAKSVAYAVAKKAVESDNAGLSGDPIKLVDELYWEPKYYPVVRG